MVHRLAFSNFILRYFLSWAVILTLVLAPPVAGIAQAKKATISMLSISKDTSDILVFSKLEGAFTDEVNEAIENGVPTTFTYYMEVKERKEFWRDDMLAEKVIKHSVRFDALQKEYIFEGTEGRANVKKATKNIDELKKWLTELNGVPIVAKNSLNKREEYYVRLKAEIKSIKLVFPLKYLFFFFSFWNFDTSWSKSAPFTI